MPGLIFGFNINVAFLIAGYFCGKISDEKTWNIVIILSYLKRNCAKLGGYAAYLAIHFL